MCCLHSGLNAPTMPEVQLNDICLWYEDEGSGPPIILVPGMLSDSASWQPVVPALTKDHRVIRLDPRCSGRTRPETPDLSLTLLARDVLALADHLSLDTVHLLGHSLGGLVATATAGRAPERITSLVVLASNPEPTPASGRMFGELVACRSTHADAGQWLHDLFPWLFHPDTLCDPKSVAQMVDASLAYPFRQTLAAMRHQTAFLQRWDKSALPRHVSVPSCAVLAQDDRLVPIGDATQALQTRGFEVRSISKAGHALHWDQPELVARTVTDWLTSFSPRP